jgi:hypothetical protein
VAQPRETSKNHIRKIYHKALKTSCLTFPKYIKIWWSIHPFIDITFIKFMSSKTWPTLDKNIGFTTSEPLQRFQQNIHTRNNMSKILHLSIYNTCHLVWNSLPKTIHNTNQNDLTWLDLTRLWISCLIPGFFSLSTTFSSCGSKQKTPAER